MSIVHNCVDCDLYFKIMKRLNEVKHRESVHRADGPFKECLSIPKVSLIAFFKLGIISFPLPKSGIRPQTGKLLI